MRAPSADMRRLLHAIAVPAAAGLALAAGACAPVTLPVPVEPPPALPQQLEIAGIPVIYKPVAGNDIIALRLYVRGGSAALRPDVAGIESFVMTTLTRGTERYDRDAFAQLSARTGASLGGSADYDFSMFSGQGVRQHWDELWDLFTQATLHPTFPENEVEIARGQLINVLRRLRDSPDQALLLLGDSVMYAGHPYALHPRGTVGTVTALSREALAAWHRDRMTKENLLLVVVGNVDRADLERRVAATFGQLPAAGSGALPAAPLAAVARDVIVVRRQLPTQYIAGFYAAPPPDHPDFAAFTVATDILSDRFFEEVRTKRNLSYAALAALFNRRANVGLVYVTTVSPDSALRVMLDEVQRIQREPIEADRLAEAINVRTTLHWLRNETNMSQAAQLGFWELSGGGWEKALRYHEMIRAVTPADVQRVAGLYLRNARFVVIGDVELDDVDRDLLAELE